MKHEADDYFVFLISDANLRGLFGVEEGISRQMFAQPFVEIDVYIIYTVYIYIIYTIYIYIFQKTHVFDFFCDQKTIYFNQDHLAANRAWIASKTLKDMVSLHRIWPWLLGASIFAVCFQRRKSYETVRSHKWKDQTRKFSK